uniref:Reverse transcriptase domain-containing protein n=1 Tax=Lactuca sativa TaxID=4236 RepID=A0A9R1WCE5_LACSA|nr:hypothetical protein LSAT_V11C200100920 [Lactuca sativa]
MDSTSWTLLGFSFPFLVFLILGVTHSPRSSFPYQDSISSDGEKHDGSWTMCIDYVNLNKSCPKDNYPLPEIDQKFNPLEGFQFKCFLDAQKGFHQVQMRREDKEKTSFHSDHGTFCYQKMPFGLENVRETYQLLMDKMFANQISRTIEVYVNDMVIKIQNEEALICDIKKKLSNFDEGTDEAQPRKAKFSVIKEPMRESLKTIPIYMNSSTLKLLTTSKEYRKSMEG